MPDEMNAMAELNELRVRIADLVRECRSFNTPPDRAWHHGDEVVLAVNSRRRTVRALRSTGKTATILKQLRGE